MTCFKCKGPRKSRLSSLWDDLDTRETAKDFDEEEVTCMFHGLPNEVIHVILTMTFLLILMI